MTVFDQGAVAASASAAIVAPDTLLNRVSDVVFGNSSTLDDAVTPLESATVTASSLRAGYSWSGAMNDPDRTPWMSSIGCWWQCETSGQCSITTDQSNAESGSVPS